MITTYRRDNTIEAKPGALIEGPKSERENLYFRVKDKSVWVDLEDVKCITLFKNSVAQSRIFNNCEHKVKCSVLKDYCKKGVR